MSRALLLILLLALSTSAQTALLEMAPSADPTVRAQMAALDLEVLDLGDRWHLLVHDPAVLPSALALPGGPTLVTADLAAHYRARHQGPLDSVASGGSYAGMYTAQEAITRLDQLVSQAPGIFLPKMLLGSTHEGRNIWAYKISDNVAIDEAEPEVVLVAGQHAREPMSVYTAVDFAERLVQGYGNDPEITRLVDTREIWVLPLVNVDGYVHNEMTDPQGGGLWRKNRRPEGGGIGIDPNRNWPYQWGADPNGSGTSVGHIDYRGPFAASEPCVQAVRTFLNARDPALVVDLHAYGEKVLLPYSYRNGLRPAAPLDAAAHTIACRVAGLEPGWETGFAWQFFTVANGTLIDYCTGQLGGGGRTLGVALEIGGAADGFYPAPGNIQPLADAAEHHLLALLELAGPVLELEEGVSLNASAPSSAQLNPGDTGRTPVRIRNVGLSVAENVALELTSNDLWVGVLDAPLALGTLAPQASVTVGSQAPRFAIGAAAMPGARVGMALEARATHAQTRRLRLPRVLTTPATLAFDTAFETAQGFVSGAPGDTATGGQWERGDPIGTVFTGWPGLHFNPEDDHTPLGGTDCWFTGQGVVGQSFARDDVDGTTTLLSPVIDLEGVQHPVMSYWRWMATGGTDAFLRCDASNDGGQTWVPLELTFCHEPEWLRREFHLEAHLSITALMQFRWVASDPRSNTALECAIDDFRISGESASLRLRHESVVPGQIDLVLEGPQFAGQAYFLPAALSARRGVVLDGGHFPLDYDVLLDYLLNNPGTFPGLAGALDAQGRARVRIPLLHVPNGPLTIWTAGLVVGAQGRILSMTGARAFDLP